MAIHTTSRFRRASSRIGLGAVIGTALLSLTGCFPGPLWRIDTYAGTGVAGFSGDGGPAAAAQFNHPGAIAYGPGGELYVTDNWNSRIRMITDTITTVAGTGTNGFSGDGGPATDAKIFAPAALATDRNGNLYIADQGNQRIRMVDTSGTITTIAGTGVAGFSGDGGPATDAEIDTPTGLAVDSSGAVYVSDSMNHRVRKIDTSGTITTYAGDGSGVYGGDGGPATSAGLRYPEGLAFDRVRGNLFIADSGTNRVREVDSSGTITTVAGNGVAGFAGDGGPATSANVGSPDALALDFDGNLAIEQSGYHVIRQLRTSDGTILPLAGTANSFGYAGDGGNPLDAVFRFPSGIVYGTAGNLYIVDSGNHRVRYVRYGASIGGVVTDASGPVAGLTVNLYSANPDLPGPLQTTTTAADGSYGFQVELAEYRVEIVGDGTHTGGWWNGTGVGPDAQPIGFSRIGDFVRADALLTP
jgi:sugar lactone lactonase YvrE